ncbi:hypothetical protein ScalyP_jg3226 [Parmales sp. scaly parma]|nr:hypothetical protein ScalyP_jg3226 [Parmales sp. scaly parma]
MEAKEEGKHEEEAKGDKSDDADSEEEELAVEREFKALMNDNQEGEICVANDPRAKAVVDGFKINWMNMRDGETGELMWESGNWGASMWEKEIKARIPAEILQCNAVSREINFSSTELMEKFKLEQKIFFQGCCIEEWFFDFGFVIPGSTNSWQQIIEAADPDQMMPAEMLTGEITIETSFHDGDTFLAKSVVRIYYV